MKKQILTIICLTLLGLSDVYSQKPRKLTPRKTPSTEKINTEIQKQLSLMFEAKELQALLGEANIIRFKQFDDINKTNFRNFKLKNKTLEILDSSEITAQNNTNYFYIASWGDVLNMLNVEIIHQATKTKVKILLTKKGNIWEFGTSELVSAPNQEQKDKAPARKTLRRRG